MAPNQPSNKIFRAVIFCATVWTVASWIFLVDNNLFSQRERFHESDFIMTFYVAGRLVREGRSGELYPVAEAESFVGSPFDRAAHEFLPHLPKNSTGAYMYIPLVAGFFAPLSLTGPNLSMFLWQLLSVLALAFSCWLMARITAIKTSDLFFLASLFAPVFLTLWGGQLGLGFGLAPLCAGFYLLLRERPLAAGMAWSLLLLKPQYFLAAALVALILCIVGRYRTMVGMLMGLVLLPGLTVVSFSPELTMQWLESHRVSDSIFSRGLHGIPAHLITGLPANLLILFPPSARAILKWPLYAGSAVLWLVGLRQGTKLARAKLDDPAWMSLTLVIGASLCALTLPHLLYYDLCVLLPAGVLLLGQRGPVPERTGFFTIALIGWIVVSGFLPLLLTFNEQKVPPLILELVLLVLFLGFLRELQRLLQSTRTCSGLTAAKSFVSADRS